MLCLYNITVHWTWNCPKCGNDLFSHYLFIWINTLKLDETVDWVNSFRLSDAYMHQYNIPTLLWTDNGMSPVWGQAIIWTNAAILSIRPKGTYFCEILFKIQKFSFKEMHLEYVVCKMVAMLSQPQCFKIDASDELSHDSNKPLPEPIWTHCQLTHWGWVTHICISKLINHHWFR